MKKITLLAIAALTLSLTSCKKNYVCTCNYPDNTVAGTYNFYNTKSKATASCNAYNSSGSISCTLK